MADDDTYDDEAEPQSGRTESEEQYVVRLEKHWKDLAWRQGQGQQDDVN